MADFFIYNRDGVLPEYTPGIPGYGQMGSTGDTGDTGSSVYYCAFDLSNSNELATANLYIQENKELSNNTDVQISGEYQENDIIIDCTGGIYKLVSGETGIEISQYNSKSSTSIYASTAENITGLDVYCATAFLNTSMYCWKITGNYEQSVMELTSDAKDSSVFTYVGFPHKVRYRNKLEDKVYGNYVNFRIHTSNSTSYNKYTYVLCFPNGKSFKTTSDSTFASFFVDNRYIYGMFDVKTWMNVGIIPGSDTSIYGIASLTADGVDGSLIDLIEFNGVNKVYPKSTDGTDNELQDASMNGEWKKDVTVLCSEFIKNNCTAYVDVFNTKTNKMYRIDFDDIFLSNTTDADGDTQVIMSQTTNIESVKNNVIWKIYNYPAHAWLDKDNNSYDMDAYVPFVIADPSTVDEYAIECYYVAKNTRSGDMQKGTLESYINDNVVTLNGFNDWENWTWHDSSAGNRVVRVYFRNLSTFSLSIKYNSTGYCVENGEISTTTSYPTTLVYVGAPDCNLIQYGKNSPYNEQIKKDELTGVTGIIDDCGAGIYYLNKFVAPGIDTSGMSGNVMEAGLTDYTLTCADYGLDSTKYHYIEIGFVPFATSDGETVREYHANIPADELTNDADAMPQRRLFYNPDDKGNIEILPFHIPGNDYENNPVSGKFDLSLNLYAITDSVQAPTNSDSNTGITYNPIDFVYKDTI